MAVVDDAAVELLDAADEVSVAGEALVTGEGVLVADAVVRFAVVSGEVAELLEHAASVPTSTTTVMALRRCLFIDQLHPLKSSVTHMLVASDRALSVTA